MNNNYVLKTVQTFFACCERFMKCLFLSLPGKLKEKMLLGMNETSFELRAILSKIYKTHSTHLYTLVEYQNRNDILLNLFLEKPEHVQ